jgi:hypothetical protein
VGGGGVLSIKDIIEIAAIVIVGAGLIDAISQDQSIYRSNSVMENDDKPLESHHNDAYAGIEKSSSWSDRHTNPNPTNSDHHPSVEKITRWKVAEFILVVLVFLATATAAYYTRQQWLTADDQEKRSLRAYMIVTGAKFERDQSGRFKFGLTDANGASELLVDFDISNEGVTPAYNVEQIVAIEYPFHGTISKWYTRGIAAYVAKQQTLGPIRTQYFTKDQIEAFSSGKGPVLLFAGQMTYYDIFKRKWPTNFCFIYAPAPIEFAFVSCPRGSETDRLTYAE